MPLSCLRLRFGAAILAGWLLFGCAQTGPERSAAIHTQAAVAGWQAQVVHTPQFDLQSFNNGRPPVDGVLTVYLEGDGYAWIGGQYPSDDPTPYQAIALQLAMVQPGKGAVAYLGRPCQYTGAEKDARCHKGIWSDARFSEEVVRAVNTALDQLKRQQHAQRLELVGYSGGAAVALLVAARRNDIDRIVTVAGNLDPHAWAAEMKLQPLKASLDTTKVIEATAHIPQVDFVGGKDRVVPPRVTESFVQRYPVDHRPRIIEISENSHACCWVAQWPTLWKQTQANPS